MARRSSSTRRTLSLLLVIAALGLSWWLRREEEAGGRPWAQDGGVPERGGEARAPGGTRSALSALERCRLVDDRSNDGDSFVIDQGNGEEITLRLYFVDSPEKYRHPRGYNEERIADQGAYFGGLGADETVAVGQEARDFAIGLLERGGFRVFTRWEPVYDSERIYGFVEFTEGPHKGRFLSELLVENGLARIHTKGVDAPGGIRREAFEARLRALEAEARRSGQGAWGSAGGR